MLVLSFNRSILCGICLTAALSSAAPAAEPVTNTLTAQRVVRVNGTEHLETADTGKPGDVIQYTVCYHNGGNGAVHALQATLPIPVGVALVADSLQPTAASASLDGTTFGPMPLMQHVRHTDGTTADEPVPVSQIRYVRWSPTDLSANGSLSVSARVVLK